MKVLISGTGQISSLGTRREEIFQNIVLGKSAVQFIEDWTKQKGLGSFVGAPAVEFQVKDIPRSTRRTMSRMSEMAARATLDALEEAQISKSYLQKNSSRILICMGSTSGSPAMLEEYFKKHIERGGPEGQLGTAFFKVMNHSVSSNVGAALEHTGPCLGVSSACATSAQAAILGWELVSKGVFDIAICGGADELHHTSPSVFDIVHAASRNYNDRPQATPRPFDRDRDGLAVSEGAGVVILESEKSAMQRNAPTLANFCAGAYGCSGAHMSQSDAPSMFNVISESLSRANISSKEIDYVNAHATGTLQGDLAEAQAIVEAFGSDIAVSSLKGHLGHSLAACGAIEIALCIEMLKKQTLLGTRNLENPDEKLPKIQHIFSPTSQKLEKILSNNFAFGGMNTSLILSKI